MLERRANSASLGWAYLNWHDVLPRRFGSQAFPIIALIVCGCVGDDQAVVDDDSGARLAPQQQGGSGLVVRKVGAIPLEETGGLYIGRPTFATVAPDGSIFVSDAFSDRIVEFAPNGESVRFYGGPGDGPGEFSVVGPTQAMRDSLVIVSDPRKRILSVFRRDSAEFIRQIELSAGPLYSLALLDDDLWFGALDMSAGTSLGVWNTETDGIRYGLRPPESYINSRTNAIYGIFPNVNVLPISSDTILVGFMPTDYILVVDASSFSVMDTLRIPALRRRGASDDLGRRFDSGELSYPEMLSSASALFHLHRLPDGSVLAIHYDGETHGGRILSRVWFTLIRPQLSSACVDNSVPLDTDIQPVMAIRGDTVYVLTQRVVGDTAETSVAKYILDAAECIWSTIDG